MATRVDLHKDIVAEALQKSIDSTKRAMTAAKQPQFKELYDKQLKELTTAANTLAEIK